MRNAIDAQEEGLDLERLSRTYAALMVELQETAGIRVHMVKLTPATLAPVLPEGEEDEEEGRTMRRAMALVRNWRRCQRGCGRWRGKCGEGACGAEHATGCGPGEMGN
jgi:hypothetical protein